MYEMSQERAEPVMPISESLEINISWQTVSNAALKSRSIRMFISPESMDKRMSLTTQRRAVSELCDGRKSRLKRFKKTISIQVCS